MMIVDDRQGSAELAPLLSSKTDIPVTLSRLAYGDVAFVGRGEGGTPVDIGIEYKQLSECAQSLRTNRLNEQAEGMQQLYDFRWLLVEGELSYDKHGQLLRRVGRRRVQPMLGRMTIGEFLKRILVLHLRRGLNPLFSKNRRDTIKLLEILYRVWTDQDLDEHKSHLGIYQAPALSPVSDFRRTIRTLPGIGHKTSWAIERHFGGSLRCAIGAQINIDEWATIETLDKQSRPRRLGHKTAERIQRYFQ